MLFTRDVNPTDILKRVDMQVITNSQLDLLSDLNIYNLMLQHSDAYLNTGYIIPIDRLEGFCEVPDTYYITTPNDAVCVFIKAKSEPHNVVWDNKIAITVNVPTDSLVFLKIQGEQLTYDDDKILFIRCVPNKHDAVNVMFLDNYGLPQYATLEKGRYTISDSADATYKSYQGQLTYSANKQPLTAITVGDNNVNPEMRLFYSGLINSPVYSVLTEDKQLLECAITDGSVSADRFNKGFVVDAVLQLQTKDLHKI